MNKAIERTIGRVNERTSLRAIAPAEATVGDTARCLARCRNSSECEVGRACEPTSEEDSVCAFLCDEDSDCESGICSPYSNRCLRADQTIRGAGLNAECNDKSECRSGICFENLCMTRCDPDAMRCPDDGICTVGLCLTGCTRSAECPGAQSCMEFNDNNICF